MPLQITCSTCGKRFSAPDAMAGRKARCKCGAVLQLPLAMTRPPKKPEAMDLSSLEEAAASASGSQAYDFANEPAAPAVATVTRPATTIRQSTRYAGYVAPKKPASSGFWRRPIVTGGVGSGFLSILLIRVAIRAINIYMHAHPQQVDNTPAINFPDPTPPQEEQPQVLESKPAEPPVQTFHFDPGPMQQFHPSPAVVTETPQYIPPPPIFSTPSVPRPAPQLQQNSAPPPVTHPRREISGNPALLIHAEPGDLLGNEVPADVMGARSYAIRGPRKFSSLFSNSKSRGWSLDKVDGVPGYFEVAVIQKPGSDVPIATSADSSFGVMQNGVLQAGGAELQDDWIDGIDFKRAEGKVTRFTHPAISTLWVGRDGMNLIILKIETAPSDTATRDLLISAAESLRHLH